MPRVGGTDEFLPARQDSVGMAIRRRTAQLNDGVATLTHFLMQDGLGIDFVEDDEAVGSQIGFILACTIELQNLPSRIRQRSREHCFVHPAGASQHQEFVSRLDF